MIWRRVRASAIIYKDAQRDYTEVFHSDREIADKSLGDALLPRIDTRVKGDTPVLSFNPMAWPRSETVKRLRAAAGGSRWRASCWTRTTSRWSRRCISQDAATHRFEVLARVDDVPALGYAVLHAAEGQSAVWPGCAHGSAGRGAAGRLCSGERAAEGGDRSEDGMHHQPDVDGPAGKGGVESLAAGACGNQLQTFKDTPKKYDAWNIDPGTLDHMTPIEAVDSVTIRERGPLRATVRVARSWQASKFVQEISLDAGADQVEVANDVDWHETHVLLKAAFPLAASGPKATYEIPYGSIERTTLRNNSWEKAKFEVPAMRWADLGDASHGVSVLNDSKYGYDAEGNTLRITLLRSPTWPDPDADRGRQQFRYAIYPHAGEWKQALTVRRGYELNYPLTAEQVFAHTGQPAGRALLGRGRERQRDANRGEEGGGRRMRWSSGCTSGRGRRAQVKLHVPAGASFATREQPDGEGGGRAPRDERRCCDGADQALRDPYRAGYISAPCKGADRDDGVQITQSLSWATDRRTSRSPAWSNNRRV